MPESVVDGVLKLSWEDVDRRLRLMPGVGEGIDIYGVPRGGAIVAGLARSSMGARPRPHALGASIIVDDIVDSGATRDRVLHRYPGREFVALVDKPAEGLQGVWVQFPWEAEPERDQEDNVRRIIQAIGDDAGREELLETPGRVVRSWAELFSGYKTDPKTILKWFKTTSEEPVIVRQIDFWSTCEHHMLPFWGVADVAYLPNGKVVGLSKIPRLVNAMARKLQIQERMTREIGQALEGEFVLGVAVSIRAHHACAVARGARQRSAYMETSYMSGPFREDPVVRETFRAGVRPLA